MTDDDFEYDVFDDFEDFFEDMTEEEQARVRLGFRCLDCEVCTCDSNEYYVVVDDVWRKTGLKQNGGMLCIGCLETRIGRELDRKDFVKCPLNFVRECNEQSERLKNRLRRRGGTHHNKKTAEARERAKKERGE